MIAAALESRPGCMGKAWLHVPDLSEKPLRVIDGTPYLGFDDRPYLSADPEEEIWRSEGGTRRRGIAAGAAALLGLILALTVFIVATASSPRPVPPRQPAPIAKVHKHVRAKEYAPSPDCCEKGVYET